MSWEIQLALIIAGVLMFMMIGFIATLTKFYLKARQGTVWVRTGVGGVQISFGGIIVIPILHRLEVMDITAKKIELRHFDDHILKTNDGVGLNAQVGIVLRIEPTAENVLFAVQTHGAHRASDQEHIEELFRDRFEERLVTSLKQFTWKEIDDSLEPLKQDYFGRISDNLLGFVIDDISFGHLTKPIEAASPLPSKDKSLSNN